MSQAATSLVTKTNTSRPFSHLQPTTARATFLTERATFLVDRSDLRGLRNAISKLAANGYSETSIAKRLGLPDLADIQWRSVPIYRSERLSARDQQALAIDLFLLQGALPQDELRQLFSGPESDLLARAGLLAIDATGLARARASLFPVGTRLIFSDHDWPTLPHPGYTTVPPDQVMAIGRDSHLLARCTTPRTFRSALDLCTGSGVHAFLASAHAQRVLAVDISPRAARCARFNAQVSGITNIDVAIGDLFEAASGESFDLITANPPFVPSPLDTLRFRDGGPSGEDIQKRIVAGLPLHLAPSGIAQMVTELGERNDEPLALRLRDWLQGAPMDIHILRLGEYSATKYAIAHAQGDDYQSFLDSTRDWAANLRAHNYARIVSLVISFQWSDPSSGPPWERIDESLPPRRAAGAEIDAAFQAERQARRRDLPQALAQACLRPYGPIALLDARVLGSNTPRRAKATLLRQALTIDHHLDPLEREILNRIDSPIPMPDLIALFRHLQVDEPTLIAATRSLLRRQLIRLEAKSANSATRP